MAKKNKKNNNKIISENKENAQNQKKIFLYRYKINRISADTFDKNCVYNIIDKEKKLQLRNKIGVKNVYDLIDKKSKCNFGTTNPTKQETNQRM